MAPDGHNGSIRVFVHWRDQTVFAGEDIKCTITFKNVARESDTARGNQPNQAAQQRRNNSDRQRLLSNLASPLGANRNGRGSSITAPPPASNGRGHRRSALSLSIPSARPNSRSAAVQWPSGAGSFSESRPGHAHKRSLSIVSIGSGGTIDDHTQRNEIPSRPAMLHRGHNRASSLQIMSKGNPGAGPQHSPRNMTSPLYTASYPPDRYGQPGRSSTAPSTPGIGRRRSPRTSPMPDFHFPAGPPAENPQEENAPTERNGLALRPKDSDKPLTPAARILSSNSMASATPRSSGEFYAISNHSSETLASEYPAVRSTVRPPYLRGNSGLPSSQSKVPESIMMGYAQVHGSFLLDGSLVSLGQFDEVKKRGVVGGRGGGVVGLDQNRRDSGLLRGFGWGAISNSLGDFLGGNELSTMKEMRGAANSKAVPLLSTPQSILFVDMQLLPGESRSFEYTLRLPRGLPPTHKGKALKISYSLVIGTQRAGGAREQQVRSVEIPFRVLGSVNSYGEILGHDLMSPYILLKDEALVKAVTKRKHGSKGRIHVESKGNMSEFLAYVDELVTQTRDDRPSTLLSPTDGLDSRRPSMFDEVSSTQEAIHLAIMRSNLASEGQSQNRFEIARNGKRIGAVMLPRPAYRLGEVVTMVIDFTEAEVPCYAVHATLETSEKIDASLAVRSDSSIQRVTRKVYEGSSETTMYSRRIVFTPTIPISATPEFVTSGVSFEWKIRVEFVVPAKSGEEKESAPPTSAVGSTLLEQISKDDKGGLVLVAVENLACESFDVSVPLKVYGAVGTGLERLERDESLEGGLAV
ncbi:Rgp1 [Cordyceps fumosorosea ARSEF 2679]|uniref:Rgp1 n=1 Tax=Cordyceps fumosorosea (strain ARSEF 2679) TaxID=1081104 RepID=A0A167MXE4_CORFA|nr:Rgp1 [Cordyceps fumosorosea ARSEF 2679]OAA54866.1 Rgp1 [Cordyceps fumosorosea ARSEF 2679]